MTRSQASEEQVPSRGTGWALAVLAAAEVALVGWWATTQAALLFVLGQALLVALLALVLVGDRYLRFRRAFERDIAHRAVQQQRRELAEDMHDVLGQELSLIAVRAGALQVTTTGPAAEQAAQVRGQVEQAVLQLRQTVELLRTEDPSPASLEPPPADVSVLVARARAAGADITTSGVLGPSVSAHVRLTAHRLVQECLTNAAKHAPGAPVTVTIDKHDAVLQVAVETEGAGDGGGAAESGLRSLRRRIDAIGGELQVRVVAGRHVTQACIPLSAAAAVRTAAHFDDPSSYVPALRRPGTATLRWALVRIAVLVAVTVSFYAWATHDATLEQNVFDGLREGHPITLARSVLPDRQAPVRLSAVPPTPAAWRCTFHTDGNFPLGMATFEICDDGTTGVDDSDPGSARDLAPWVDQVATSLIRGGVNVHQPHAVGTGTDFDSAINTSLTSLAGRPGQRWVFLLSDGQAAASQGVLDAVRSSGVAVRTFAVGTGTSGCEPGSHLALIAAAGGDACFAAPDPSTLVASVLESAPSSVLGVEVEVGGGSLPATVDAIGNWSVTVPALARGAHTAVVTARFADGTSAQVTRTFEVGSDIYDYVALGDSFASGEGIEPYLTARPMDFLCHRSSGGWPTSVRRHGSPLAPLGIAAPGSTFTFAACSGARLENMDTRPQAKTLWQILTRTPVPLIQGANPLQLNSLSTQTDLVTVSIGGNDLGFGEVIQHCYVQMNCFTDEFVKADDGTSVSLATWMDVRLAQVNLQLEGYFRAVRARVGADATVIATTYPRLFPAKTGPATRCSPITNIERTDIRARTDLFAAIVQFRAPRHDVRVADVRAAFEGRNACEPDAAIAGPTPFRNTDLSLDGKHLLSAASLHPTAEGAQLYADAVTAVLDRGADAEVPGGGTSTVAGYAPAALLVAEETAAEPDPRIVSDPAAFIASLPSAVVEAASDTSFAHVVLGSASTTSGAVACDRVVEGEVLPVVASGFGPGSAVTLTTGAGQRAPGTTELTADADGRITGSVVVPDVAEGQIVHVHASSVANGRTVLGSASVEATDSSACYDAVTPSGPVADPVLAPTDGSDDAVEVRRLAGADRIATAVAVARSAFPTGASSAVLVSSTSAADALTASYLAGVVDGPVLLTGSAHLSADTAAALEHLGVERVHIVGGPAVVSVRVEQELREQLGEEAVSRCSGEDRMQTSLAVLEVGRALEGSWSSDALLVRAYGNPVDGLVAGPLSFSLGLPILLVDREVPTSLVEALRSAEITRARVLGGPAAVPREVDDQLTAAGIELSPRAAGASGPETAALIAELAIEKYGFSTRGLLLARGDDPVDALAGASLGGRWKVPMILTVDPSSLGPGARGYLQRQASDISGATVLGGPAAVDRSVLIEAWPRQRASG